MQTSSIQSIHEIQQWPIKAIITKNTYKTTKHNTNKANPETIFTKNNQKIEAFLTT